MCAFRTGRASKDINGRCSSVGYGTRSATARWKRAPVAPDKAQEQPAAETAPAAEEQAATAEDSTPAAAAAEEQPTVSTTFVFNDKPVREDRRSGTSRPSSLWSRWRDNHVLVYIRVTGVQGRDEGRALGVHCPLYRKGGGRV